VASKTDMGSALASVPFFILTGPHSCLYRVLCCPVSRVVQSLCLVPIFRASVEAIFFVRVRVYPGRPGPQQSAPALVTPAKPRETLSTAPSWWRSPGPASRRQRGRWGAWCEGGAHPEQRRAWGRHERCAGELAWGRSRCRNSMRPRPPPPTGAGAAANHDLPSATRGPSGGAVPGRLDQAVGATRLP